MSLAMSHPASFSLEGSKDHKRYHPSALGKMRSPLEFNLFLFLGAINLKWVAICVKAARSIVLFVFLMSSNVALWPVPVFKIENSDAGAM